MPDEKKLIEAAGVCICGVEGCTLIPEKKYKEFWIIMFIWLLIFVVMFCGIGFLFVKFIQGVV